MHQLSCTRIAVVKHKWVGSKDTVPWLSRSAQDFVFLKSSSGSLSFNVYLVDYVELVGWNPFRVCVLVRKLWMLYFIASVGQHLGGCTL